MVIEDPYIDNDFLDDFSQYFSRCFHQYGPECRRLHFFTDLDDATFDLIVNEGKSLDYLDDLNHNYRGNIVVRPLPMAVIGRTFLYSRFIDGPSDEDTVSKGAIRCFEHQSFNLFGIDLSTRGVFFQEQDQCTGACATSALWSALQFTAGRFKHTRPTRYQVTSLATKNLNEGRAFPSTGLNADQMCEAIRSVGLEPEVSRYLMPQKNEEGKISFKTTNLRLLAHCYSFLRGRFPVILLIYLVELDDYHAITVTGYKLSEEPTEHINPDLSVDIALKGSRISEFYVHDDVFGPYIPTPVKRGKDHELLYLDTKWKYWLNGEHTDGTEYIEEPCTVIPYGVIVPVPPLIRVKFQTILGNIFDLNDWIIYHKITGSKPIEWDIHLTSINDYKRELLLGDNGGNGRRAILLKNSPKYFWRCKAFTDGKPLFELFADATDMEPSCQFYQTVYHHPEVQSLLLESLKDRDVVLNLVKKGRLKRFFLSNFFHETIEKGPLLD